MRKRILIIAGYIFTFLFSVSVIKNMIGLYISGGRLHKEYQAVGLLEKENEQLRQQIAKAQKPEYIEQVARDELNMAKPGETVVVIAQAQIVSSDSYTKRYIGSDWHRWYALFFDR